MSGAPEPFRPWFWAAAVGGALIVGLAVYLGPGQRPPQQPQDAAENDDLAHRPEAAGLVAAIQAEITQSGYVCPRIGILWDRGQAPLGQAYEAVCSPSADTSLVNTALHYAVYPGRGLVVVCKPLGPFGSDCP